METLLLAADEPGVIERAAALLAAGEPVVLPTETVYGLAADAAWPGAVASIFQVKDRPFFDPLIVHLPGHDWLGRLAAPDPATESLAEQLIARFWPGPLTILLPRRADAVPDLVTAGSSLVALRMSAHPVFRAVIAKFGRPLAAPSANRFGRISPTTGQHALSELGGRVSLIVEAGPTTHGLESTIIAVEPGEILRVLRHGPVTAEMLTEFGRVQLEKTTRPAAAAPGQLPGHYAPRTPLVFLGQETTIPPDARCGLLAYRRDQPPGGIYQQTLFLSEAGDLREAAVNLFAALRALDEAGHDRIVAEPVPMQGLGQAIMERLSRAVAGSGGEVPGVRV